MQITVCLLCDILVLVLVEIGVYHDMHVDKTKPVCTCRDGRRSILIVRYYSDMHNCYDS